MREKLAAGSNGHTLRPTTRELTLTTYAILANMAQTPARVYQFEYDPGYASKV
jgi:hypothetical protein